jgi:hypothetical protein
MLCVCTPIEQVAIVGAATAFICYIASHTTWLGCGLADATSDCVNNGHYVTMSCLGRVVHVSCICMHRHYSIGNDTIITKVAMYALLSMTLDLCFPVWYSHIGCGFTRPSTYVSAMHLLWIHRMCVATSHLAMTPFHWHSGMPPPFHVLIVPYH